MHECNAHFGVLSISSLTSWDVTFMNHVEYNSEMIRNLSHKIDDLKGLIEKLIKDYPLPPPKE
jgi:hypothetical protein